MECLNEATLTRQRDHYHSRECKTCEYCHLTAAFPKPCVDKPGDPVDYFQDYTPHCLVCRYVNECLFSCFNAYDMFVLPRKMCRLLLLSMPFQILHPYIMECPCFINGSSIFNWLHSCFSWKNWR